MTSGEAHPEVRRMMTTAIRRLNGLEYAILGVVMALALLAGALVARVVEILTGEPSRLVWALASLLFFVVPGWIVLRRERRARMERQASRVRESVDGGTPPAGITEESDNGGR